MSGGTLSDTRCALTTSGKAEQQDIPESEPRRAAWPRRARWISFHSSDAGIPSCLLLSLRSKSLPALLEPQLCTLVEEPPGGADWLHEIKYDGWRLLGRKHGDDVRLYTRGGVEWSQRLPHLVEAIHCPAWPERSLVDSSAG